MSRHENYISELRTANIRRKMLKYSHKNPHNEVWCPYEMTMRCNVNVNVAGSKYVTCVSKSWRQTRHVPVPESPCLTNHYNEPYGCQVPTMSPQTPVPHTRSLLFTTMIKELTTSHEYTIPCHIPWTHTMSHSMNPSEWYFTPQVLMTSHDKIQYNDT